MKSGIELIAQERKEQILIHGFAPETDAEYVNCELEQGALHAIEPSMFRVPENWGSWFEEKMKQKDEVQRLIVAGALIAAAIDRLNAVDKDPLKSSDDYAYCNHYHELTEEHEIVNFGDGDFVANKVAMPLLKALNEAGLKTRTHHMDAKGGFVSILLENVTCDLKTIEEAHRTKYNGQTELLISWTTKK